MLIKEVPEEIFGYKYLDNQRIECVKAIIMLLFMLMTHSFQQLLKACLSRNWERLETEVRDIQIIIQRLPGSVLIWKNI